VYFWKYIQVRWIVLAGSHFMFQGDRKNAFMLGKEFPYLLLNLRFRILA
jgi:hypothetical protein